MKNRQRRYFQNNNRQCQVTWNLWR